MKTFAKRDRIFRLATLLFLKIHFQADKQAVRKAALNLGNPEFVYLRYVNLGLVNPG